MCPRQRRLRTPSLVPALMACALVACGSQLTEASNAEPTTSAPVSTAPIAQAASDSVAHEDAPPLTLSVVKHGQRVTLVLQNRERTQVRFNSNVLLESLDTATPETQRLPLHLDEARPLPTCAELAPGALLELDATANVGVGAHRFVLTSCDEHARVESERFAL